MLSSAIQRRLLIMVLVSATATPVASKVAATSLRDLTRSAKAIAVVKVSATRKVADLKWANATVIRGVKGVKTGDTVTFLAEPTWTCDISEARVGETALVFLVDARHHETWWGFKEPDRTKLPNDAYLLAWSGRGRMPIRQVKREDYVTIWYYDVGIPNRIRSVGGPEPQYSFIRSFALEEILGAIELYLTGA